MRGGSPLAGATRDMIRWDDAARTLELSVQDLVEGWSPLAATPWSLPASPRTRARLGQVAHRHWQAVRAGQEVAFEPEVAIRHVVAVRDWTCVITGRIDGISREGHHLVVEELKSSIMDAGQLEELRPEQLHSWCQQLQIYLHLLSQRGEEVVGRLVLVSLVDGWRRLVHLPHDPSVGVELMARLDWMVAARQDRIAHRRHRRAGPRPFAHSHHRQGQEDIVGAVREALGAGSHLLVSAPTGVGKTAAVLQGALDAAYDADKRVFFATARTTQQRLALDTLHAMWERGFVLRAVGLRARGRACPAPVMDCHPERCALARDAEAKIRSPDLLDGLLAQGLVRPDDVARAARSVDVCPWLLGLELAERCDVVIGDYNYVFDPDVALRRWFGSGAEGAGPGDWLVLVDEAHHLPQRARGWLSPRLDGAALRRALVELDGLGEAVAPHRGLVEELVELIEDAGQEHPYADDARVVELDSLRFDRLVEKAERLALDYAIALQRRWRAGQALPRLVDGGMVGDPYQLACRSLARFHTRLGEAGEETVALYTPRPEGAELALFCREPAVWLGPRLEQLGGSVSFSGTLEPLELHRTLLGLAGASVRSLAVSSPFTAERQLTLVTGTVSTRFKHRERDRERTAQLIERAVQAIPGNCAVLFPSFAMRDQVAELLVLEGREPLVQPPDMPESARHELLGMLADGQEPPRVLLGVSGGIFGEGVDLPGRALLGMVVVGPALPAVTPRQRLVHDWYARRWGDGFELAYMLPGMTRVVQAAGRVIRSESDHGVVVLLGQRFLQHRYAAYFPPHWRARKSSRPWREIEAFFEHLPSLDLPAEAVEASATE